MNSNGIKHDIAIGKMKMPSRRPIGRDRKQEDGIFIQQGGQGRIASTLLLGIRMR